MVDNVILKKHGFFSQTWDSKKRRYKNAHLPLTSWTGDNGRQMGELWNVPFSISGRVTLGDLVGIFMSMSHTNIGILGALSDANLQDYLDQLGPPRHDPDRKSGGRLKYIEVYKGYELDNYSGDGWKMQETLGCHGIGEKWEQGAGNSYAIEFTPWEYMLHLPIRINETAPLCTVTWKKKRKKKVGLFDKKRKRRGRKLFDTDREYVGAESRDVQVSFTFGEFFRGLFDELCFFSNPPTREENKNKLDDTLDDLKNAENESDRYFEMKEYD